MIVVTFDALAYDRTEEGQLPAARQPIQDSQRIYEALYARFSGRIIILGDSTVPHAMLEAWAKREGYKFAHVELAKGTKPEDFRDRVRDINAVYGKIDWFVDTNPETVKLVMQDAIPSLLICLPNFVRPEWRDNAPRERKVWTELTREIEVQSLYRNTVSE
jgi:hypothetical protein